MLRIGFVVVPGFSLISLAAASVFEFANLCSQKQLYEVQIFSEEGGSIASAVGVRVDTVPFDSVHLDTLIICGNPGIFPTSPALRDYVVNVAALARRTSSICTGSFVLADAGLLRGRRATTHWMFSDELQQHPSGPLVERDVLFVIDDSIWTAAGNSAGVDLALGMLEGDHGPELARLVARVLVLDQQRSGKQSQHSAMLDLHPKSDRIQDVLAYARRNLRSPLPVQRLAKVAALSPRQFGRAFHEETGMTPAKAIERLRVEAARLMLEKGQHTVGETATETGFGDEERMRRAILRVTGQTPRALRQLAKRVEGRPMRSAPI